MLKEPAALQLYRLTQRPILNNERARPHRKWPDPQELKLDGGLSHVKIRGPLAEFHREGNRRNPKACPELNVACAQTALTFRVSETAGNV
jgi:hypothetical protein